LFLTIYFYYYYFIIIFSNYLFELFCHSDIDALFDLSSIGLATNFLVKVVNTLNPIKIYNQFKQDRLEITKKNKNKSGIYCLVNLL